MISPDPQLLDIRPAIRQALDEGGPLVALESAVLTHGLPAPANLDAAVAMCRAVEAAGATPAVCLISSSRLVIGAPPDLAADVAGDPGRLKASVRDIAFALASGRPAGLTVSATLLAARLAGIRAFATGGIGGVHTGSSGDVSADLYQLARTPVITVCSGVKSVLDIPATLELLETLGVPVVGYRTSEFPAFYMRSSGKSVLSVETVGEVRDVFHTQVRLGYETALVVANPIPPEYAIKESSWETWSGAAKAEAERLGVSGKEVTPFLLARVAEASGGETVRANLSLLEANARLAGQIASALAR